VYALSKTLLMTAPEHAFLADVNVSIALAQVPPRLTRLAQPDDRFTLQSCMLKRVSRSLTDRVGIAKVARIRTTAAARRSSGPQKGEDRRLSCSLPAGVETVSLYSIGSADALEKVADRMKQMWSSVIGT
jgi:hypothetical protein